MSKRNMPSGNEAQPKLGRWAWGSFLSLKLNLHPRPDDDDSTFSSSSGRQKFQLSQHFNPINLIQKKFPTHSIIQFVQIVCDPETVEKFKFDSKLLKKCQTMSY